MPQNSDQVLERLHRFHPKVIDLSLERMNIMLTKLGHPERKLPPVIHVAGTNGKGSTTAYLRAILEAAGLSVHVYSSPHLVSFSERIRLAGKLISEEKLLDLLLYCEQINGETPITYFEITTAIAFKAFSECPADVVLLEVGLGGRLDATNVIEKPLSTVITPISMDHEHFLGTTLQAIAHEKAGIAKKNVPLILGPQEIPAKTAVMDYAEEIGALLYDQNHWTTTKTDAGFLYQDAKGALSLPYPNLHGPHQISNAALAIACLRHQDKFNITSAHIEKGITSVVWPARLQDISQSLFGKILPNGSELWLDGGHNPAAGQVLANHFSENRDLPLYLICGMMAGKDARLFLSPLSPLIREFYGLTITNEESYSAEGITQKAKEAQMTAQSSPSAKDALKQIAAKTQDRPVRVLICGSLYLAGHVLRENELYPT
ncbi:MAG: bifunctional folylpolyglutamate synthase/dihydrofolate synthase [Emcibacter sp.]|nr:bifunctional folylpolyglutamate synthase/dihydrofolate synthase [Emcibacter sp.]